MKNINDNYVTIQGWMTSKLNLKGAKLMAFALIYGFCQDGKSRFKGSVSYISMWTGTSDRQTQNALNSLESENLISKILGRQNGVDTNEYTVNFKQIECLKNFTPEKTSPLKKVTITPEIISPVPLKKLHPTGEIISPNINSYNIDDNIEDNIEDNIYTPDQNQEIKILVKNETEKAPPNSALPPPAVYVEWNSPGAYLWAAKQAKEYLEKEKDLLETICQITISSEDDVFSMIDTFFAKHCDSSHILRNWQKQFGQIQHWLTIQKRNNAQTAHKQRNTGTIQNESQADSRFERLLKRVQ